MEVGLDGNIFTQSFTDFGHLATHSWFKILWQYASQYQVQVLFHPQYQLLPTRLNDKPLIPLFRLHNYIGPDLTSLCRTRKFYQVHSLADVICADGTTVDPKVISGRPGSSSHVFSWEQPTPSDFALWESALRCITSPYLRLTPALGPYLCEPHVPYEWFASEDEEHLYHHFSPAGYDIFKLRHDCVRTRSGRRYDKISTLPGQSSAPKYASIVNYASNHVTLHSTCPVYTSPTNTITFLTSIRSSPTQSLWSDLHIDGDGEWFVQGLLNDTIDACNDGSWMPDLDSHACSGAFIMRCRETNQEIRGCFTDKSRHADNYRGELLGALGPLLLIKTAVESNPSLFASSTAPPTVNLHCDNRGVILHGNDPNSSIKDGQVHADLVRLLKQYSRNSPLTINWIHIKGHSDDSIGWTYPPFNNLTFDATH
jgi:hypothetical protein